LNGERSDADLPPPALGQHTEEILAALGIARDDTERLKSQGVVG
jgi:crotonobetainyl-CoA:carnitine CoA-transferase CaiB-like acyl-CoA transferase